MLRWENIDPSLWDQFTKNAWGDWDVEEGNCGNASTAEDMDRCNSGIVSDSHLSCYDYHSIMHYGKKT